jgi:ABC-type Na+ efflux pump permease subunit
LRPRKLLRIARWEVTKSAGNVDRRTLAVVALVVGLFVVVGPLVATTGLTLDENFYRVGVEESSPYYEVIQSDDTFVVVDGADREDLERGSVDLVIEEEGANQTILRRQTQKSEAAYEQLRSAVKQYNEQRFRQEDNETAAFPVEVVLDFRQQGGTGNLVDDAARDSGDGGDGDGGDGDGGDGDGGSGGDDDGSGGDGDGSDGDDSGDGNAGTDEEGGSGGPLGGFAPLSGDSVSGSPAEIEPPFPFQSLVLALFFVVPLNFLIQAYGSTILSERINRRGELMLVSPVSRFEIIGGKTLPYFLGAILIEAVLAVGLLYLVQGRLGGLLALLALTPLVLLFLGATFLGAMFARSFKELTFVTITITVTLTAYAFVPAIFSEINEIALISPLTIVVRTLQAESIGLGEFAFSTVPPLLVAVVCFGLGSGLYREEDMFDQRSISGRVLDALAGPIRRRWHVGVMTAVLIPIAFVAQLLAIALLFVLGQTSVPGLGSVSLAVLLILIVVGITEELAKSLHIYAAYDHGRFDRGTKTALALGLASGVGFFLAEKIALLAQLVGLPQLDVGEAGLQGGVVVGPVLLLFLLAPLALHVGTAAISAVGASRGKAEYAIAVACAMVIHIVYNLTVVVLVV